jgi:hypothetical protein
MPAVIIRTGSAWWKTALSFFKAPRRFPLGGLIQRYGDPPIRAQFGLRSPLSNPKISPYRAPFKNNLKSGLFLKSGEIKRSYKHVLRAVFGPGWVFCWWRKWSLPEREYGPLMSIIRGSNWDYFGKRVILNGFIFERGKRAVFWAWFWWKRGIWRRFSTREGRSWTSG